MNLSHWLTLILAVVLSAGCAASQPPPTPAPSRTPTLTPTREPRPTHTPRPTVTHIHTPTLIPEALSTTTLTLDDLPAGFEVWEPDLTDMTFSEWIEQAVNFPVGDYAAFADPSQLEYVFAYWTPLDGPGITSRFDETVNGHLRGEMRRVFTLLEGSEIFLISGVRPRLARIGDITEVDWLGARDPEGAIWLQEMLAFRRENVGVIIAVIHPGERFPIVELEAVARALDARLAGALE